MLESLAEVAGSGERDRVERIDQRGYWKLELSGRVGGEWISRIDHGDPGTQRDRDVAEAEAVIAVMIAIRGVMVVAVGLRLVLPIVRPIADGLKSGGRILCGAYIDAGGQPFSKVEGSQQESEHDMEEAKAHRLQAAKIVNVGVTAVYPPSVTFRVEMKRVSLRLFQPNSCASIALNNARIMITRIQARSFRLLRGIDQRLDRFHALVEC